MIGHSRPWSFANTHALALEQVFVSFMPLIQRLDGYNALTQLVDEAYWAITA